MMAQGQPVAVDGMTLGRSGAAAVAVLGRSEYRNALSTGMIRALNAWYPGLARDPGIYALVVRSDVDATFSIGCDLREVPSVAGPPDARAEPADARAVLAEVLGLCWLAECFTKPTISLIDGVIAEAAAGIAQFGTHRIAGENYCLRVSQTLSCVPPGYGLAHALARMPMGLGLYLGLTGEPIGRADAFGLGLVTHCIARSEFGAIERQLGEADPVDPVLDSRHLDPGAGALLAIGPRIERYFSQPTLPAVLARLAAADSGDRDWATRVLAILRARSPLGLVLTDQAIRRATDLDVRQTLIQDYRLAHRLMTNPDFREGLRASIAGDAGPRWTHARVEDVPTSEVDGFFTSLGQSEFALASRADMQSARV